MAGLKDFRATQDDAPGDGGSLPTGMMFIGMTSGPPAAANPDQATAAPPILINYNERFADAEPTLYRDAVIEQALSVLIGRGKPNALLTGPAGVGKTKIVEDIARRIAVGDCLIPAQLQGTTIYELPISEIISGSSLQGQVEAKLEAVVEFAQDRANDVVIFVDEIHLVVDDRDSSYAKIGELLKPALARGDLRMIGATTNQEARDLDNDPAFNRRFTRVIVDELTPGQTVEILSSIRPGLIEHYKGEISVADEVLEATVEVADQNSRAGSHRPDSAITLLDRAMADRVLEKKRLIATANAEGKTQLAEDLAKITTVPLTSTRVADVATRLLTGQSVKPTFKTSDVHEALTSRIQGQDEALTAISDRLGREQLNLFPRTTPITWMLAGASGVGKTETAKMIAQITTGQEPIILNMTEYTSSAAVQRIIGSPAGYVGFDSNAELPLDALDANPYRVILLDEFEKADPAVQRLFLSAFDEGYIRTSRGKLIDFSKAIVFATTNAARDQLEQRTIGFGDTDRTISHQSLTKALAQHFDAELLGRFTLLVGYRPITQATYREILVAGYRRLREELAQHRRHKAAQLPEQMPTEEIDRLVTQTHVPNQGARPAAKALRAWIEDHLMALEAAASTDDTDDEGDQV